MPIARAIENQSVGVSTVFPPRQIIAVGTLATPRRGFDLGTLRDRFLRFVCAADRWREMRKATAMLGRAAGAMLRDLGITESGIENAVRRGRG